MKMNMKMKTKRARKRNATLLLEDLENSENWSRKHWARSKMSARCLKVILKLSRILGMLR